MKNFHAILCGFLFLASLSGGEYYQEAYRRSMLPVKTQITTQALAVCKDTAPLMTALPKKIAELRASDAVLADCLARRLEIAGKLKAYIEKLCASSDPEAFLFARTATEELRELHSYFQKMLSRVPPDKNAVKTFNVRDFGARGDGIADDAPAFAKALAAIKKYNRPSRLFIPRGDYLWGQYTPLRTIAPDAGNWRRATPEFSRNNANAFNEMHIPLLRDFAELTIEGENGTRLIGGDPRIGFFYFLFGKHITVRDLEFSYRHKPFTQGTIIAVDDAAKTVKLKLDPGCPVPDLDYFLTSRSLYGVTWNAEGTQIIGEAADKWVDAVRDCGDGVCEVRFNRSNAKSLMQGLAPGRKMVISARKNLANAGILTHSDCEFLRYENLTVTAVPSQCFGGSRSHGFMLVNCRIIPPEGENSLLVSNADASMLCNSIIGPYLAGNDFRYIGDDVFNVYSDGRNVLDAAEDGSWITASDSGRFRQGDLLSVVNTSDGSCRDARIAKLEKLPKGVRKLHLSPALPQIVSQRLLNMKTLTGKELYIVETLGADKTKRHPDMVMNRRFHGTGTVISGNRIRYSRAAGIFLRVSNVLIENNVIENMRGSAIHLHPMAYHYSQPHAPHTVTIRGNEIRNNRLGIGGSYHIYSGFAPVRSQPIRDVEISGNRLENNRCFFTNIQDLKIENNSFLQNAGLELRGCANVVLDRNSFAMPEKQALKISGDTQLTGKGN